MVLRPFYSWLLISSLPEDGRCDICAHANQTVPNVRLTWDLSFHKVNTGRYWLSPQLQRVLSRGLLIQAKQIKPEGLSAHVLLLGATSFGLSSFTFHSIARRTMQWPTWTQLPLTLPIITAPARLRVRSRYSIGIVRGTCTVGPDRSISANILTVLLPLFHSGSCPLPWSLYVLQLFC